MTPEDDEGSKNDHSNETATNNQCYLLCGVHFPPYQASIFDIPSIIGVVDCCSDSTSFRTSGIARGGWLLFVKVGDFIAFITGRGLVFLGVEVIVDPLVSRLN